MKKKDRKVSAAAIAGAIVRMLVICLSVVVGLFLGVTAFIQEKDGSVLQNLWGSMAATGCAFMIGIWIWAFMKWCVFIAPKSFGWANKMWRVWIPLTLMGLAIKVMLWIYILLMPITAFSLVLSPLYLLTVALSQANINFLMAIGVFGSASITCVIMVFLDICRIAGVSWRAFCTASRHPGHKRCAYV